MDSSIRIWLGIAAAALGAVLLLLVPTRNLETINWETGAVGDEPFAFVASVDIGTGTVGSDVPGAPLVSGRLSGMTFAVSGTSGSGEVLIRARDEDGAVHIDETVGPDQWFRYPPQDDATGYVLVSAEHPELVPAPGGEVVFVLTVANPPGQTEPVTIFQIGVEPHASESPAAIDSGRRDSCARLDLPHALYADGVVRCTYTIEITGGVGNTFASIPFVETDLGYWSTAQPVSVAIASSSLPWPEPPPPVSGRPGNPIAVLPIRDGIQASPAGRYQVTMQAAAGSPGFAMQISGERTDLLLGLAQASPARELGLWLAAAALTLLVVPRTSRLIRLGGAVLLAAAATPPLLLAFGSDHSWYWREGAHLIWAVAAFLAGCGASLVAVPFARASRIERRASLPRLLGQRTLLVVASAAVALTGLSSPAWGGSFLGGDAPGSYSGDYLFMGVHVLLFQLTIPLVALASAVATRSHFKPAAPTARPLISWPAPANRSSAGPQPGKA